MIKIFFNNFNKINKGFKINNNKNINRFYSSFNSNKNQEIKFSKYHVWASIPKNNEEYQNDFEISVNNNDDNSNNSNGDNNNDEPIIATIGITDEYTNKFKGDTVLYIKYPFIDNHAIINEECIYFETLFEHFKVLSPISGRVTAVNQELLDYPNDVNEDPNKSWLAKIQIQNKKEFNQLMNKEEYEKYCDENFVAY